MTKQNPEQESTYLNQSHPALDAGSPLHPQGCPIPTFGDACFRWGMTTALQNKMSGWLSVLRYILYHTIADTDQKEKRSEVVQFRINQKHEKE